MPDCPFVPAELGGVGESAALPRDAVVIRGGSDMTVLHLTESLKKHAVVRRARRLPVEYGLSVVCLPEMTADQVARHARLGNGTMRISTVGQLQDAGFEVVPTPGNTQGHCDVFLQGNRKRCPNGIHLARFAEAFGQPVKNPGRPRAGKG